MKSLDLAKYVINVCIDKKRPLSNLQLNKVLFILNRKHIEYFNSKLIDDEFEVTENGIIYRPVFKEYCIFGANPITIKQKTDFIPKSDDWNFYENQISLISVMQPWELTSRCKEILDNKTYKVDFWNPN